MGAAEIKAPCDRTYHASRSSGVRDPSVINLVGIHSEEAATAESAAAWFANPEPPPPRGNGPAGSAHLCVDDTICYRTLRDTEIPWAAASALSANLHGIHIEMAGFARWNGVLWLLHRATIQRAAYKTAEACARHGIPVRFLFADDLVAGRRTGITTHAQITKASKRLDPAHADRYDHTDPGIFFPRRYFMRLTRGYFADLGDYVPR